jgi:NAD(P)H-hydrate epimerase
MQLIDKISQERFGIPSITLMENAGQAAASCAMDMLKDTKTGKRIAVFCGKGNNGGDGFVISRKLIENSLEVTTYILYDRDELKSDPAANFGLLEELGADIVALKDKDRHGYKDTLANRSLIIDAIFGTGFKGAPNDSVSEIITAINRSGAKILSIDVPSGLDATSGRCKGECVKATRTITFGLPKSGFYKEDGPGHTGKIVVKNIGFPETLLSSPPQSFSI